jgi:hypothetical protein
LNHLSHLQSRHARNLLQSYLNRQSILWNIFSWSRVTIKFYLIFYEIRCRGASSSAPFGPHASSRIVSSV